MSLNGQVEDLGVAELLYMVGISRRSGLLRLEARSGEFEILFRAGLVVAARDRKAPVSLHDLLVRRNLVDATHLAVLDRQAAQQGKPLSDLLQAEGLVGPETLDTELRQDIERAIAGALELRTGTFSFDLVADEASTAAERFGGLVLAEGLRTNRLAGVGERSGGTGLRGIGTGLSLPRTEGGRQVELLVDDADISLPLLPPSMARRVRPETTKSEVGPKVVLAIGWPTLGRLLRERIEAAGLGLIRPRSVREAAERVEAVAGAGASLTLIADAALSAIPGLELLARVKLAHRATRAILLLDRRGTPAQLAAHRERAERLGVTHVLLQGAGESEPEAHEAADELMALVLAPPVRDEAAEPEPVTALPPEAEPPPEWVWTGPERPDEVPLSQRAVEAQDRALATMLRELASVRLTTELAVRLLEVAAEYGRRALLFVPSARGVRALGFCAHDLETHARLRSRLPGWRLPPADADLPCACLRDGRSRRVPAALAGAGLLGALGERAREVAALPLVAEGRPVAVVVLDDGGAEADLPPLAPLERFLAGAAVPFAEALERDRGRSLVRRERCGP